MSGKEDLASNKLKKPIPEDSEVTVRWLVRDDGEDRIKVQSWIKYDEDGEFKEVVDISSGEYEDIAKDKNEFRKAGASWIRVNGNAEKIPFKNVSIIELEE